MVVECSIDWRWFVDFASLMHFKRFAQESRLAAVLSSLVTLTTAASESTADCIQLDTLSHPG